MAEPTKTVDGVALPADASPWIEIFRAGDYRPQGKALITRSDLERVIRNYDPTYHEAPVCIGHPKDNLPAYGWIERLALDGDKLLARERQVDPQFDEARKAGRYKKRSAAFYQDASGKVSGLRHVAWLGAQPPEVKGLQDVQFNDNGREFIELNFGEEESVDENKVLEGLKAFFAEKFPSMFGDKGGSKTFSEDDMKRVATEAATAAAQPLQQRVTELETKLKDQGTQFAEREKQIASTEVKQRGEAAIAKLKGAGKWIPAFDKMGLGLVFDELAKSTQTVEFGEGDAKKQVAPLQVLVEFMEGLPKIVPGGTHFNGSAAPKKGANTAGDALSDAAYKLAAEKKLSFSEALDQVAKEHPELVNAGTAAAGAV